jgi:hypothetical protein
MIAKNTPLKRSIFHRKHRVVFAHATLFAEPSLLFDER